MTRIIHVYLRTKPYTLCIRLSSAQALGHSPFSHFRFHHGL